MPVLTKPSSAFSTSLIYITVGTLLDVWTIVSWIFYPPTSELGHFLLVGFLVTGIAVLAIGLFLGPIGRAARHAELPPAEVTESVAHTDQTTAANPPVNLVNTNPQTAAPVVPNLNSPSAVARVPMTTPLPR
jgi:hypothetical protein